MSQRPKTKQDTIGKQGYALRCQGLTWREITAQLGGNVRSIEKLVARYAKEWGKKWPVYHDLNQPYNATKRNRTLVNETTGCIQVAAKAWAEKHNLTWPIPVITGGQRAYRMRQTGAHWRVVAALLGYRYRQGAVGAARSYAHQNGLTWPPPRHTNTKQQSTG